MKLKFFLLITISLGLVSCVSPPKVLQGNFDEISIQDAQKTQAKMKNVRWSGQIIQVTNDNEKTCFVIVSSETDAASRPLRVIPSNGGRFIACKKGFLEPKAFENRVVTVTGKLSSYVTEKIDELDYLYPVITTDKLYIWREAKPLNLRFSPFRMNSGSPYFCRYSASGFCY